MIYQIIISLAALFGLIQLNRMSNSFAKVIVIAQGLAILISLITTTLTKTIGFYLFGLMLLVSIFYVLIEKKEFTQKVLMLLIAIPVFISFVFKIFHWPFASVFSLMMLIPIISYLILITRKVNIKNEIGFLTIILTEAVIGFSFAILFWLNLK